MQDNTTGQPASNGVYAGDYLTLTDTTKPARDSKFAALRKMRDALDENRSDKQHAVISYFILLSEG